jgi:nitroreductase
MELMEAIRGRYTHRGAFLDQKIERDVLLEVLEAARWAPSGHNSQPWEFLVVDDRKEVEELMAVAGRIYAEFQKTRPSVKRNVEIWLSWTRWSDKELETKGDGAYAREFDRNAWEEMLRIESEDEIKARFAKLFAGRSGPSMFSSPPALVFTLLDTTVKIPNISQGLMQMTSIGAAIQNLRIAAHGKGLATHEYSVLYDLPQTRARMMELLDIPSRSRIVSAMKIGYPGDPATSIKSHVRKPLEKLVHWNRF